jgi:hypothetical protein
LLNVLQPLGRLRFFGLNPSLFNTSTIDRIGQRLSLEAHFWRAAGTIAGTVSLRNQIQSDNLGL